MRKHLKSVDDELLSYLESENVVRVELELKKRELSDLGLNDLENLNDEVLSQIFERETADILTLETHDEDDLMNLPFNLRCIASSWLAGDDLSKMLSRATYFRRLSDLRMYGWDVSSPRPRDNKGNVLQFKQKLKTIVLEPLTAPDWYLERDSNQFLKVVNHE